MIIRTAAETVDVSQDVNREKVDWKLEFKDRIGNEFRVYVTDNLVEDMLRQIKEQRGEGQC